MLVRYQLWDTNQKPVYEKCAAAFEQRNPGIEIQIENKNWGDHWSGLARGFIGETAPDVFTDHLGKYPRFSKRRLDTATWNPTDGGTFEQLVAKLSIDTAGRRGDQPGFDPENVKVYGLGFDPNGLTYGQTTWAGFAASLGFELLDKNPWGTKYQYDDPRFAQTITWWRKMIRKGYLPSLEQARPLGETAAFQSGRAALAVDGDWMIGTYSTTEGVKVGYSPQPAGPKRSWSMYNGLADAIWAGTKHPQEAAKWVSFLASRDVTAFTSYVESGNTVLCPITDKAPQINLIVQPRRSPSTGPPPARRSPTP